LNAADESVGLEVDQGLFGFEQADELLGMPMMDMFEPASQAALKGALIACARAA